MNDLVNRYYFSGFLSSATPETVFHRCLHLSGAPKYLLQGATTFQAFPKDSFIIVWNFRVFPETSCISGWWFRGIFNHFKD